MRFERKTETMVLPETNSDINKTVARLSKLPTEELYKTASSTQL